MDHPSTHRRVRREEVAAVEGAAAAVEAAQEGATSAVEAAQATASDAVNAVTEGASDLATEAQTEAQDAAQATADAVTEAVTPEITADATAEAEAATPSELLTPEGFNYDRVIEMIDGSELDPLKKTAVKSAITQARDNPELLKSALQAARSALGL